MGCTKFCRSSNTAIERLATLHHPAIKQRPCSLPEFFADKPIASQRDRKS